MAEKAQTSSPRLIADFAMIGDCQTAALVHRDATIEWLCWPRFDSEACFASLLGAPENGQWKIAAIDPDVQLSRRYREETLILETRVVTPEGSATLLDFMPPRAQASDVIRIVIGEQGTVRLKSDLRLRFDYGRLKPRWDRETVCCAAAEVGPHAVCLDAEVPLDCAEDGACGCEFSVAAGQSVAFVLTYFVSYGARPRKVDPKAALQETEQFWADWVARCTYDGPAREAVVRSLITMKALVFQPSGGIAAAPTSSLPERAGGERNWDYRYCWLRDATFTLLAFLHCGYEQEAASWRDWLVRAAGGEPAHLQPLYGMGGEARLPEWEADWLCGFGGAKPVRFGNLAYVQQQLDVPGEVVDALYQARLHGLPQSQPAWQVQVAMVEHLEKIWQQPDRGIWESRDLPQRFTQSQAMLWAAFDRAISTAERENLDAPLDRWRAVRDQLHREICEQGWNAELNSFVRYFGSDELDASVLLLPQIGFLPATDPRIAGTVAAIGQRLKKDGFIMRYDSEASKDGLPPGEGTFLACSLWYADVLAMMGRYDQAHEMFDRVLSIRNDLGLLAEGYDPATGTLTGNFPQALSHLTLVNTALNLTRSDGPAKRRGNAHVR